MAALCEEEPEYGMAQRLYPKLVGPNSQSLEYRYNGRSALSILIPDFCYSRLHIIGSNT
jgi:hypothetical protein